MRHKLLAYYSNPAAQPAGKPDWERCESDFEREVGRIICARGYRLIPQYEPFGPGGYRIDFVIEGLKLRLAVEVDGPNHEDPERIEHDMYRQRQLERSGWVFWRVSASSFVFDRDKAMASLWRRLEELGIQPLTTVEPKVTPGIQVRPRSATPQQAVAPCPVLVRPTQIDLVVPPQLELSPRGATPAVPPQAPPPQPPNASAADAVIARLKRSRPDGFFFRKDICEVALAFLQDQGRMSRRELTVKVIRVLDMPEHHETRVENALEELERNERVVIGAQYVSLKA